MDDSATTRESLEAYARKRLGFSVNMANAHDSRIGAEFPEYSEESGPSAEWLAEGITFVNLTDETLGIGHIPLMVEGDSVGSLYTQFGATEAENITRFARGLERNFEWVPSRSESTIMDSATHASWVLLVCRRAPNNMVELLEVQRAEYPTAWQVAALPGILAAERPVVRVVLNHENLVGPAAAVLPTLVEALARPQSNTMLRGVPAISPSVQVTVDVRGNEFTYDVDPNSCTVGSILSLAGLDEFGEIYGMGTDALDVNDAISEMKPTAREGNRLLLKMRCFGPEDIDRPRMKVHYKTLTGKSGTMMGLLKSDTVYDMKLVFEAKEGIPLDQQRLIFRGRQLEDGATLESVGISTEDTVHQVLRLRGGCGSRLFRCPQTLRPLPPDAVNKNNSFSKRPRRDLKGSQILVVNYTEVAVQLFFFPTSASHTIKVAGGVGLSLAGVGAKAKAAQTVAVNHGIAYGQPEKMFLLNGADQIYDIPRDFNAEALMVGGTVEADSLIFLRDGCQLHIRGRSQLDVMPGFLKSPALDPCTIALAVEGLHSRLSVNQMRPSQPSGETGSTGKCKCSVS